MTGEVASFVPVCDRQGCGRRATWLIYWMDHRHTACDIHKGTSERVCKERGEAIRFVPLGEQPS